MNSGVVFCVEFQWEASVELWVLSPLLLMMLMLQGRANEEMKWITPYTGSSPNHNRRKRWSWRKMREASFGILGTPNIFVHLWKTTLCLQKLGFLRKMCQLFFGPRLFWTNKSLIIFIDPSRFPSCCSFLRALFFSLSLERLVFFYQHILGACPNPATVGKSSWWTHCPLSQCLSRTQNIFTPFGK